MISTVLCIVSFCIYIVSTYEINMDVYFDYLDWVIIFYFLVEIVLRYSPLTQVLCLAEQT